MPIFAPARRPRLAYRGRWGPSIGDGAMVLTTASPRIVLVLVTACECRRSGVRFWCACADTCEYGSSIGRLGGSVRPGHEGDQVLEQQDRRDQPVSSVHWLAPPREPGPHRMRRSGASRSRRLRAVGRLPTGAPFAKDRRSAAGMTGCAARYKVGRAACIVSRQVDEYLRGLRCRRRVSDSAAARLIGSTRVTSQLRKNCLRWLPLSFRYRRALLAVAGGGCQGRALKTSDARCGRRYSYAVAEFAVCAQRGWAHARSYANRAAFNLNV